MLKIKELQGTRRAEISIDEAEERTFRGIRQAFFKIGRDLTKTLKAEVLKKNKRGRVYKTRTRGGRRRTHRASAPGQTPANKTGNYRRNVGFQIRGSHQMEWGIRNGAPYAVFLEEGTSRMAPRPGLRNTVDATTRNNRSEFDASLERELLK